MSVKNNIERILADKNSIKAAIEAKGVTVGDITLDGYADKIALISSSPSVEGKLRVRFIDYDGTILQETYINSGESVTPPTSPTHDNLTFQDWNYNSSFFSNITTDLDIGATYITTDGKTHFYITLMESLGLSPTFYFTKTDTSTLTIDWGDGTNSTSQSSGSISLSHTYSIEGGYVVKVWISSGTGKYGFGQGSSTTVTTGGSVTAYLQSLNCLFIGSNVNSIGDYAFSGCNCLSLLTIPNGILSITNYTFRYCYSIKTIIIPNTTTLIGNSTFVYCTNAIFVIIPNSVTSIGLYAFQYCLFESIIVPGNVVMNWYTFCYCYNLKTAVFLNGVKSIESYCFLSCYSLETVELPNTVLSLSSNSFGNCYSLKILSFPNGSGITSVGVNCFEFCYILTSIDNIITNIKSISDSGYRYCFHLTNVTIPSTVTTVYANSFYNCYSIVSYTFQSTTPPTLSSTNAFTGINSICKIRVPAGSLSAYQTATNWATYASYMEEY